MTGLPVWFRWMKNIGRAGIRWAGKDSGDESSPRKLFLHSQVGAPGRRMIRPKNSILPWKQQLVKRSLSLSASLIGAVISCHNAVITPLTLLSMNYLMLSRPNSIIAELLPSSSGSRSLTTLSFTSFSL